MGGEVCDGAFNQFSSVGINMGLMVPMDEARFRAKKTNAFKELQSAMVH